ncbi:hypothetical protein P3T36_003344 [Kitasatospora sp. MAP12-15]|uniref:hypothetical protein n=1 Tax=unclassified Kitasatospora TaxID=2633591 RepID=UPI002475D752|nr:hypothetical protein [Kitasatospora sp. MAP12-44]MDH6111320.1 hypothetical protein [Kitasatospora sp. MAP12-44]
MTRVRPLTGAYLSPAAETERQETDDQPSHHRLAVGGSTSARPNPRTCPKSSPATAEHRCPHQQLPYQEDDLPNQNVLQAAAAISRLADQVSAATGSREVYSILEEFNAVDDGVFERLIDLLSAVTVFARRQQPAWNTAYSAVDQLWALHQAIGNAAAAIREVPDRHEPAGSTVIAAAG